MGFWYLVPVYCPLLAGGRISCYNPAIALYGRQDSNLRPLAPKASTLTWLCYSRNWYQPVSLLSSTSEFTRTVVHAQNKKILGGPRGVWTPDLRIMSPLLLPTELWAQIWVMVISLLLISIRKDKPFKSYHYPWGYLNSVWIDVLSLTQSFL